MTAAAYASVDAFYAADERRRRSPELDLGVWWRRHGVVYRLTWVDATGELIAVQLTPARVTPFHVVDEGPDGAQLGVAVIGGEPESVAVIGRIDDERELERILDGWADVCGAEDSLVWVLRQLQQAGVAVSVEGRQR